jgi:eukaryotic translation initiation factor 2-alpha kinase 4
VTAALATFQSTSVKTLLKEQRSFGFWTPRRCDVYAVSYQPGYLKERLEVVSMLWQYGISADLMYELSLPDAEQENYLDVCLREGILWVFIFSNFVEIIFEFVHRFTVYPRPRTGRQTTYKIKSVLKGTEYELSKQELVPWLQHQILEQKRIDQSTSGVAGFVESVPSSATVTKDLSSGSDVHLLLPGDTNLKKQRKQTKQIFLERGAPILTLPGLVC